MLLVPLIDQSASLPSGIDLSARGHGDIAVMNTAVSAARCRKCQLLFPSPARAAERVRCRNVPQGSDSVDGSDLLCDRIAEGNPDASSREHMYPESLSVAETVIGALDFGKHDFLFASVLSTVSRGLSPQDEIRNSAAPRLAYCECQSSRGRISPFLDALVLGEPWNVPGKLTSLVP